MQKSGPWKIAQCAIEDALRKTLFIVETGHDKMNRLKKIEQFGGVVTSKTCDDINIRAADLTWSFANEAELRAVLGPVIEEPLTSQQCILLAIQLKDANIKRYVCAWLSKALTVTAVISASFGFALPLINKVLLLGLTLGTVIAFQALLIGFCLTLLTYRKRYMNREKTLLNKIWVFFNIHESFEIKKKRLPDALRQHDQPQHYFHF
jgi:hypothetical protein